MLNNTLNNWMQAGFMNNYMGFDGSFDPRETRVRIRLAEIHICMWNVSSNLHTVGEITAIGLRVVWMDGTNQPDTAFRMYVKFVASYCRKNHQGVEVL